MRLSFERVGSAGIRLGLDFSFESLLRDETSLLSEVAAGADDVVLVQTSLSVLGLV